jgi:hypothetical protein
VIITIRLLMIPALLLAGMVPFCLRLRLVVRLRVSVVWMRVFVPRMRLRTLGSACAVFDGLQNSVNGATKMALD